MSGICGIYNYLSNEKINSEILNKMVGLISHRGPLLKDTFLTNNLGLAVHYSRNDVQSKLDCFQDVYCILDGKIFNKNYLTQLLEDKKINIKENSDSWVLASIYKLLGEEFIDKIDGEFAFSIWDNLNKKLILGRNHAGNKPLYYTNSLSGIIFASEIKSILAHPQVKSEVDPKSLDAYFTFHDVPTPDTLFKGIKQVPAASILICQDNTIKIRTFWRYNSKNIVKNIKEKECSEKLYSLLSNAVKKRLGTENNVGAFLSSGIDSSTVVYLTKNALNKSFNVFSVGFNEKAYSELPDARRSADCFGVNFNKILVDAQMGREAITKIINHTDLPFWDISAIPTYYGGFLAKKYTDVVLTGDGSDQLLGGSTAYADWKKQTYLFPEFLRTNFLAKLLIPFNSLKMNNVTLEKILRNAKFESLPLEQRYALRLSLFKYGSKYEAYNQEFKNQLSGDIFKEIILDKYFNESNRSNFIDKLLYQGVIFYLQDDLLIKVDRMLSANSLEFRTPFLDKEVMDFISQIPVNLKIKGILKPEKKYILRKTFKHRLPAHIFENKKIGFEPPQKEWMHKELKDMILDNLLSDNSGIKIYFDTKFIEKILNKFYKNEHIHNKGLIWALFMFELWHKKFIIR